MNLLIRWLSLLVFIHCSAITFAQHDHVTLSIGPVVPVGKDLAMAYSMGMRVEAGPRFKIYKVWNINPVLGGTMYANTPKSVEAREVLILYSAQLRISKVIGKGKITFEPLLSGGYNWGKDYAVNKNRVFPGNYFDRQLPLLNLKGFIAHAGFKVNLTKRLSASVEYQLNRPLGSLSEEAKSSYPNYGSSTIYGPVVYFDKQRFKLDNVSLNIWLNL